MSVWVIRVSACPVKCETHFAPVIVICPSTWLRVVSPSTLLRTVSLSNGWSNHFEFRDPNFVLPRPIKLDQA